MQLPRSRMRDACRISINSGTHKYEGQEVEEADVAHIKRHPDMQDVNVINHLVTDPDDRCG